MNDSDFNSMVREWATGVLEQDPAMNFDGLVRSLPGVYPSDIVRILGEQSGNLLRYGRTKAGTSRPVNGDGLPVPHPLDYDWRFTATTRAHLSRRASMLTPPGGSITLLGVPTLFEEFKTVRPDAIIRLADGSEESILSLSARHGERGLFARNLLRDSLPRMVADVVVADPPWYPEFSEAFVWIAAQMVRVGGSLLLCGPNYGTRPNASAEWEKISKFAHSLGFNRLQFEEALRYDTPPFEQNALDAAGHAPGSFDWRSGCLATFVRERIASVRRPNATAGSGHGKWRQESVGGIRWRLRQMEKRATSFPTLFEVVPGNVLDSVSRRDIRRMAADVWTSGNRVFRCSDTSTLALILQGLKTGTSSVTFLEGAIERKLTAAEKDTVNETAQRLTQIISLEQSEYLRQAEDLSVS